MKISATVVLMHGNYPALTELSISKMLNSQQSILQIKSVIYYILQH